MRGPRKVAQLVGLSAVMMLAVAVGGARAGDQVPLKGKFAGVGPVFSGKFTHLGSFAGQIVGPTTAVWTSADRGTTVVAETTSFVIDLENPIGPTLFPYTQTIQINGGSGRFAGATGAVEVWGTIDVVDFSYDGVVIGTISRPNSGR